jgi:hypothetical protein
LTFGLITTRKNTSTETKDFKPSDMKPSDMKNSWIILHFLLLACLITQLIAASTGWQQDAQLTASNGNANDQFAYSVSVSDNIAVIGAPKHSSGGLLRSGAAYIFRPGFNFDANIALIWPPTETEVLTASDKAANDEFGKAVSIDDDIALIGAPYHSTNTLSSCGKAYIFRSNFVGLSWNELQELTASDAAANDYFGFSVSVAGKVALIGAWGKQTGGHTQGGRAYIFQSTGGGSTWPSSETQQLSASDAAANNQFGWSVSLWGSIAVIGANFRNSGGAYHSGGVYIFRSNDGGLNWPSTETQVLTASDKGAEDEFGLSVSVFGNTVLIGSPIHNTSAISNSGKAYIFRSNDGGINWSETQKLIASDVATGASFGYSVYVTGNVALIGAPFLSSNTGAAYLFQSSNQGATWTQRQKLTASAGTALDQFGASVSVFGKTALIGADFRSSKRGAAYIFDATPSFSSSPESSSTSDDDDGMFASAS